jgi:preprotein translocase subunit SecB
MTEETQGAQPQAQQGPQFALQRIYIKDLSFESPNAPQVFAEDWKPQMNLNMNTEAQALGNDVYEITLMITVTVNSAEKTGFLAEIHQAGIFLIKDVPEEQKGPLMGIACPNILFPYAREAVSDLVSRGSFPQLLLQPINFEAIYAQKMQQQQAAEGSGGTAH